MFQCTTRASAVAPLPLAIRSITARKRLALVLAAAGACTLVIWEDAYAAPASRWVNANAAAYRAPGTSCATAGYPTIQAAVDASASGDIIRVCPGTYNENVKILTNGLQVVSTGGAAVTTVKASELVFQIRGRNVTLKGFTIVPAGFGDNYVGVNVPIKGPSPTNLVIMNNVVIGGRIGINLGCGSFGSTVAHNTVNGQSEGGINIDTCELSSVNPALNLNPLNDPGSHDNLVHHNKACSNTTTASIALGGTVWNNRIHHNIATKISVGGLGSHDNRVFRNVTKVPVIGVPGNVVYQNVTNPAVCP